MTTEYFLVCKNSKDNIISIQSTLASAKTIMNTNILADEVVADSAYGAANVRTALSTDELHQVVIFKLTNSSTAYPGITLEGSSENIFSHYLICCVDC